MLDRLFAPVLTFVTLIAATAGFGSALLSAPSSETLLAQGMPPEAVMLETVVITGKRSEPADAQVASTQRPAPAPASHANEGRGVLLQHGRN